MSEFTSGRNDSCEPSSTVEKCFFLFNFKKSDGFREASMVSSLDAIWARRFFGTNGKKSGVTNAEGEASRIPSSIWRGVASRESILVLCQPNKVVTKITTRRTPVAAIRWRRLIKLTGSDYADFFNCGNISNS